jgi:pyrimidine-nucleoside phosphorylase
MLAYPILARKRLGAALDQAEIESVVKAAADGSWSDAQLAAFLMAAAIQGLDSEETLHLTLAMLESGDQWDLSSEIPGLVDKHSTGGVGDKVSLVLSPLLAACGVPVIMLTGRALGHTAGTADKLESIPGLDLELDRQRCLQLLESHGMAMGIATRVIAPADRTLYRIRDQTATVDSLPLITGSILSKKLASGAASLVFDIKTGNGAFMAELSAARELGQMLVGVTQQMGRKASALITDMSQPLGQWVGHLSEVRESLECLEGEGAPEVMEVTLALAEELLRLQGSDLGRVDLQRAVDSGRAREVFDEWAAAQGAEAAWLAAPDLGLAPAEVVVESPRDGVVSAVDCRRIGLLMVEAGAGRSAPDTPIDNRVALSYSARLGTAVTKGQELARLYLRQRDADLTRRFKACFEVAEAGSPVTLIVDRIDGPAGSAS